MKSKVQWTDAPSLITKRTTFMSVYGRTGTGRTTLSLTAPGPIALIYSEEKHEGIVQPVVKNGKDIKLYNFGTIPATGDAASVIRLTVGVWEELKNALLDATEWAKTIVLDTHSEAWRVIRAARLGKLSQVKPYHYTPVNAEWVALMKKIRSQGNKCNFIALGGLKERYKNDKPTGIMEQSGQKEMDTLSDVVIRMKKKKDKGGDITFSAGIEKGWYNAHAEGLELEDELANFGQLMGIITKTDPAEWSG